MMLYTSLLACCMARNSITLYGSCKYTDACVSNSCIVLDAAADMKHSRIFSVGRHGLRGLGWTMTLADMTNLSYWNMTIIALTHYRRGFGGDMFPVLLSGMDTSDFCCQGWPL